MADAFAHPLAQTLLDAHTSWVLERLSGPAMADEIRDSVQRTLDTLRPLKIKDLVKGSDVTQVALKYACDVQIGGIIPELVGDVARDIYDHKIHAETTLNDLLPDNRFADLRDKLLELKELRDVIATQAVANPIFAKLVAELLGTAIRDYVRKGTQFSARMPGAKSAFAIGKKMMERARPDLGEMLDDNMRLFIQKQTDASLRASEAFLIEALASEEFREVITEVWDNNKHRTVASIRDYAGQLDIEELFVIGYEHWQEFRQHKAFATLIRAGVDAVYRQIGTRPVGELLDAIGISEAMIHEDAQRFAPTVIKHLHKKKLLEPVIRDTLRGYYESPELNSVLAKHVPG